jgi:tetratricopeptide (TPR) repeat protein
MAFAKTLAVAALAAFVTAQEAPLRFVAGRPMLLVTLRADSASYPCHLLLDLSRRDALYLHDNAAQSLGALRCEVAVDGSDLRFTDLPVGGSADRWLERFTAQHAEELKEVPVAGYLGLGAFGDGTLSIDGPAGTLTLRSAAAGFEKPPAAAGRGIVDLLGEPAKKGLSFQAQVGGRADGKQVAFALHSKEAASWIEPRTAQAVGAPTGRLPRVAAGAVDLAAVTPFRPEPPELAAVQGTIGGAVLQRLRTTIALGGGWLSFELPDELEFPEDEAAFYDALFGGEAEAGLARFLEAFPASTFRSEAARTRLALAVQGGADPLAVVDSAAVTIEAAAQKARAREALGILESLPVAAAWREARASIAKKGLEFAPEDEDGNANHKLHLELGRLARAAGEQQEARRHLLSAAFGMRGDGFANLELGALYEEQGELERALSRYLIALLDMKNTGQEGLLALEALHRKRTGSTGGLPELLADMAEGRIPALHPIPREPEEVRPTGRVVLAELFTGAMCPPCAAADVAFDALGEFFGRDEIAVIQWHVPIPAPEPMVAEASLNRLRNKRVSGTPTAIFGGTVAVSGGGKADQAANVFAKYRDALFGELKARPTARVGGTAQVEDGVLRLAAWAAAESEGDLRLHAVLTEATLIFPGRNGILFHHHVARARLTPAAGVPLPLCGEDLPFETSLALRDVTADLDTVVASLESRGPFQVRPIELAADALSVVLFVEDPASGAVVQAGTLRVAPGE